MYISRTYEKYSKNKARFKTEFKDGYYGEIYIEYYDSKSFKIKIDDVEEIFEYTSFSTYMNGIWLEEYVFFILKKYEKENKIFDLRTDMTIKEENSKQTYQEFDAIFTDGIKLFIIKCKSGKIKQDHCHKIGSITKHFGGRYAQPIFISLEESDTFQKRAEDSNIKHINGNNIKEELEIYLDNI